MDYRLSSQGLQTELAWTTDSVHRDYRLSSQGLQTQSTGTTDSVHRDYRLSLCLSVCLSIVSMVGVIFVYVDTVYGVYVYYFLCLVGCFGMIILDTYCFERLICMCFVFLYLHLFSAIQHVLHGKAL